MNESGMKYLTPKKPIAQINRERAEQGEEQNFDLYEAVAGLFEEIADLRAEVEELKGGSSQ